MNVLLKRDRFGATQTIGRVFIDGKFECYSLEDTVREIDGAPVESWKVPGATAIPRGRYPVKISWSNRFKKLMMEVLSVPGFSGIRLHAGNTEKDTEGCVLLGDIRFATYIGASRIAVNRVYGKAKSALERGAEVWLTVE